MKKENKNVKRYYSPGSKRSFVVIEKNEKGENLVKTNAAGNPVYLFGSKVEYITKTYSFKPAPKPIGKERVCIFDVTEDTAANVAERLEQLANDPNSKIFNEIDFIRYTNPAQAEEIIKREKIEKDLDNTRTEYKKLKTKTDAMLNVVNNIKKDSSIEELKKQLAEIGG